MHIIIVSLSISLENAAEFSISLLCNSIRATTLLEEPASDIGDAIHIAFGFVSSGSMDSGDLTLNVLSIL